ncbi:MAG: NAD-binding protein [Halieaceae bacterium]
MRQRFVIVLATLLLVLLGLYGQYQLAPERLTEQFVRSLYQVFMLFFLEGEWTLAIVQLPLALELVRFLAPMATFASLLLVLASSARVSLSNYFLRHYAGHTVVVGLGKRCWQFLRTYDDKSKLVVVERDPENLMVNRVRELGVKVVIGDIFEDNMFDRINLGQADTLLAFTGSDGTNVELAMKARDHVRVKRDRIERLRVHIHLNEIGLAHQLESYPKFFSNQPITETSFFSVYDLSARLLLRDYPPEVFADVAGQDRVHLAIYGFGRLAETLMIEAALLCQYANGSRLKLTVFDEDAEHCALQFAAEYPYLELICDHEFVKLSSFGPHVFGGELAELLPGITQHVVCRETDEENLSLALMLRSTLLERLSSNAPILVHMQQSSGLAQLLESNTGDPEIPDGLYPFGMLDQVLHADHILASELDVLARCLHELYLQAQQTAEPDSRQSLQPWNDLPQWEKKQNVLKADHWPVRLRAIRCRIDPAPLAAPRLSDEEATLQATMEHGRYLTQKIFDGWSYGEVRVEEARINPFLVPWEALPEQQRLREIDDAKREPGSIALESGISFSRSLVLGVSGHRLDKMAVNNRLLKERIVIELEKLGERYPEHRFTILSPLAEGADRLVARLAMEVLDAALQVPLPLPYDLYIADFESSQSVAEFQALVGRAEYYFEMPMRFGNLRELASSHLGNGARDKQYALAGAYVIQRCDQLIAIYDGEPEAGVGGTGQMVRWYGEGGIDEEFLYPNRYFAAPIRTAPIIIHPGSA